MATSYFIRCGYGMHRYTNEHVEQKFDGLNWQPEKVTLYVGGSVYEDGVIQFLGHEEGRIRYDATATEESKRFQYDYFVKDHLGNVRMVLAEERKVEVYPIASMEGDLSQGSSPVSVSKLFYDIEDS